MAPAKLWNFVEARMHMINALKINCGIFPLVHAYAVHVICNNCIIVLQTIDKHQLTANIHKSPTTVEAHGNFNSSFKYPPATGPRKALANKINPYNVTMSKTEKSYSIKIYNIRLYKHIHRFTLFHSNTVISCHHLKLFFTLNAFNFFHTVPKRVDGSENTRHQPVCLYIIRETIESKRQEAGVCN